MMDLVEFQALVNDRDFKERQFEEALDELITHHQILLLLIEKKGKLNTPLDKLFFVCYVSINGYQ